MPNDIENLIQCIGKSIELHPVHGRDIKGVLKHVDPKVHVLYVLEETGTYTQIPLKRIGTIRYPRGFVPKFSTESDDTGELPTDSRGNHIAEPLEDVRTEAKKAKK